MVFLSLLCTGCESEAYYGRVQPLEQSCLPGNMAVQLSFFFLSLCLSTYLYLKLCFFPLLPLPLNELWWALGVAATWRCSKRVADLWQGHRDLTRQRTHYLPTHTSFNQ